MAIFRYWRHFLALEADFAATSRYVEFAPENYKVYSIEFVKLLLAIGSEVDVVAKDVCKALVPSKKHGNIDAYRKSVLSVISYASCGQVEHAIRGRLQFLLGRPRA